MRQDLERRIEQDEAIDAARVPGGELGEEPPAEAVADPQTGAVRHRVEDVLELGGDVPGRLPAGAAVTAKVRRDDVVPIDELLGELAEPAAVRRDAVQTRHRRQARFAPLVGVQLHASSPSSPLPDGR
jgi:hypothetical protein